MLVLTSNVTVISHKRHVPPMRYIDFRIPPAETFTGIRARRGERQDARQILLHSSSQRVRARERASEFSVWVVPLTAAVEDRVARARNVIP